MSWPLQKGDYVLATKYRDGDPFDGYAVGWFDAMLPIPGGDRFMVVDESGRQFRRNGFRRCERISEALGAWIVENQRVIEAQTNIKPLNMWRYRRASARQDLERIGPLLASPKVSHAVAAMLSMTEKQRQQALSALAIIA